MEENTLVHRGRPTKYTAKTLAKGWFYVDSWKILGDKVPSNVGLAYYLGISRETVNAWKNDPEKPDFSDMLGKIQVMQERELINNGLTSDFNSNICKLMLAKHGYADKQELTGRDGEPLDRNWKVTVVVPEIENGNGNEPFPEID